MTKRKPAFPFQTADSWKVVQPPILKVAFLKKTLWLRQKYLSLSNFEVQFKSEIILLTGNPPWKLLRFDNTCDFFRLPSHLKVS